MDTVDFIAVSGIAICIVGFAVTRKNPTVPNSIIMPLVVGAVVVGAMFFLW